MLGLIGEAISLRSFSSLWFWAALAAFWIMATGRIFGLPYAVAARDPLQRAVLQQAQHWVQIWQRWQNVWVVCCAAALGCLTMLAFYYGIELAQALWFFALPYGLVMLVQLRVALRICANDLQGEALLKVMYGAKIRTQLIAFVFIFITAFFAFIHLLLYGYFG